MSKVNLVIIGGGLVGVLLVLVLQVGVWECGWLIVLIEFFVFGNVYQFSYDVCFLVLFYGSWQIYE